ncbi:hypothetical protein MCOR33_010219 [Pyricularia grisea]|uniref:Transposase n=1 Tax=Pyricularia grisea TaxID=148305 RepID=A0ABQ8N680_PYRGI|nr:hypothetical protein MCOR33_010219 [Pyricularia grisea]
MDITEVAAVSDEIVNMETTENNGDQSSSHDETDTGNPNNSKDPKNSEEHENSEVRKDSPTDDNGDQSSSHDENDMGIPKNSEDPESSGDPENSENLEDSGDNPTTDNDVQDDGDSNDDGSNIVSTVPVVDLIAPYDDQNMGNPRVTWDDVSQDTKKLFQSFFPKDSIWEEPDQNAMRFRLTSNRWSRLSLIAREQSIYEWFKWEYHCPETPRYYNFSWNLRGFFGHLGNHLRDFTFVIRSMHAVLTEGHAEQLQVTPNSMKGSEAISACDNNQMKARFPITAIPDPEEIYSAYVIKGDRKKAYRYQDLFDALPHKEQEIWLGQILIGVWDSYNKFYRLLPEGEEKKDDNRLERTNGEIIRLAAKLGRNNIELGVSTILVYANYDPGRKHEIRAGRYKGRDYSRHRLAEELDRILKKIQLFWGAGDAKECGSDFEKQMETAGGRCPLPGHVDAIHLISMLTAMTVTRDGQEVEKVFQVNMQDLAHPDTFLDNGSHFHRNWSLGNYPKDYTMFLKEILQGKRDDEKIFKSWNNKNENSFQYRTPAALNKHAKYVAGDFGFFVDKKKIKQFDVRKSKNVKAGQKRQRELDEAQKPKKKAKTKQEQEIYEGRVDVITINTRKVLRHMVTTMEMHRDIMEDLENDIKTGCFSVDIAANQGAENIKGDLQALMKNMEAEHQRLYKIVKYSVDKGISEEEMDGTLDWPQPEKPAVPDAASQTEATDQTDVPVPAPQPSAP